MVNTIRSGREATAWASTPNAEGERWAGRERGRPARVPSGRAKRRSRCGVCECEDCRERRDEADGAEDDSGARLHAACLVAREVVLPRCAVLMLPFLVVVS
jgi:hypothetical protein